MRTTHPILTVTLVTTTLLGCGPARVTVPAPPATLQELVAIYQSPTGTVPVGDIQAARAEAQRRNDDSNAGEIQLISAILVALRDRLVKAGLSPDPTTALPKHAAVIKGVVDVLRTCRGWDPAQTTPDPANGQLAIQATLQDRDVGPYLTGASTTCKGRVDVTSNRSIDAYLDGALGIHLEGPLPTQLSDSRFLVAFSGTVGTDASQDMLSFDFRVVYPQVEVRVPVADGDVIASVGLDGVVFRGANGEFSCPLTQSTCTMQGTATQRP